MCTKTVTIVALLPSTFYKASGNHGKKEDVFLSAVAVKNGCPGCGSFWWHCGQLLRECWQQDQQQSIAHSGQGHKVSKRMSVRMDEWMKQWLFYWSLAVVSAKSYLRNKTEKQKASASGLFQCSWGEVVMKFDRKESKFVNWLAFLHQKAGPVQFQMKWSGHSLLFLLLCLLWKEASTNNSLWLLFLF